MNRLHSDEIRRPNPCVSPKKRPNPPTAPFTERDSTASWGFSSHSSLSSHISTEMCGRDLWSNRRSCHFQETTCPRNCRERFQLRLDAANQSRPDGNDPNEIASVTRDRFNMLPLGSFPSGRFLREGLIRPDSSAIRIYRRIRAPTKVDAKRSPESANLTTRCEA